MRLSEYQSKTILSGFGLSFTTPIVVSSAAEAAAAFKRLETKNGEVVIKAQVPFGGRAKAGAVQFATSAEEARKIAQSLLGMNLRGVKVEQVSLEEKLLFDLELYSGVTWDTAVKLPIVILSTAGGVNVESAAKSQRTTRTFDPFTGLRAYEGREMAHDLGLAGKTLVAIGVVLEKLTQAFLSLDAVTLEVNPLAVLGAGNLTGLDAHLEIDDDAFYRQQSRLACLGEITSTGWGRPPTRLELEAQRIDQMDHRGVAGRLVEFEGNLGLLIGGGGASLTVFDAIRRYGGHPANYCEVGGNPTEAKVAALTQLLLSKPGVDKLAVIMNVVNNTRADVVARGVLAGVRSSGRIPADTICLFRIPGSWEQEARDLMKAEGVHAFGREYSLDACAKLAVERVGNYAA